MPRPMPRAARLVRLMPVLACLFALGCGDDGTYRVSGKVTFKGQPVPSGKVYFMPDGSKGNTGPTGYADIKNGEYDTSATGGRGAPPGPVIIAVEGVDPAAPPDPAPRGEKGGEAKMKLLFARYETTADLLKETATKNIEVPAEAAKGPKQPAKRPGTINP